MTLINQNFSNIFKPWQLAVLACGIGVILSCSTGYLFEGKIIFRQIYMPIIIGGPITYFFYRSLWKYKNMLTQTNYELQKAKNDIEIEKEKSEKLLLNILPESIATRLISCESPIADHFDEASVVFIDIVDFTKSSAASTPKLVVEVLNVLYTKLDGISKKHSLEKIKTIGDCYMAAAGIPIPDPEHALKSAKFALDAMTLLKNYDTGKGTILNFRCGIDCGPVVAGVIGENKFIYDVWGDTVNTAARMEEYSEPGKIHVTERFKQELENKNKVLGMNFVDRGEIEIKGKGMMKTYFLERVNYD